MVDPGTIDSLSGNPLGTPDEVEHERHGRGRVRFAELVAGVENVGFHPRQCLHPGQNLGELKEGIVPSPDHQRRRLPTRKVVGDGVELLDVFP